MSVGSCGWVDRTKWFIHFNASNESWASIITELKNGDFKEILTEKRGYYPI
jgi:hypothetical protein